MQPFATTSQRAHPNFRPRTPSPNFRWVTEITVSPFQRGPYNPLAFAKRHPPPTHLPTPRPQRTPTPNRRDPIRPLYRLTIQSRICKTTPPPSAPCPPRTDAPGCATA